MSGAAPVERLVGVRDLDHVRTKLERMADQIMTINRDYLGLDEVAVRLLGQAAGLLVRARVHLHAQALLMEMADNTDTKQTGEDHG